MTATILNLIERREENAMFATDVINPCPFERRIVGSHGAFVLRINHNHVEQSVKVIRHRLEGFRIEKEAA